MFASRPISFGSFEVRPDTGEILRNGRRIRLQSQPFQLLVLLLQRPNELVTREEIRQRLWPADTFVDFDHSLGTAINKIRAVLDDSADSPRLIETLPKRGYRFIGELNPSPRPTIAAQSPVPAETPDPQTPSTKPPSRVPLFAGIALTMLCVFTLWTIYRGAPSLPAAATRPSAPVPFTALPGNETAPAFSPDGSRVVFAWDGDPASKSQGFDLYVKALGSETLLRLTHHPSEWISPVWSPDGTQIAFHRIAGADTGLYVVPALGGPERKLRSTRVPYDVAAPISWSPDGKWLAFSDPLPDRPGDRIHLLSLATLETQDFPHNPICNHEANATFSHKGDQLVYLCVHSIGEFELYSVAPFGGRPKRITSFSNVPIGFAWSADDKKIVFSQPSEAEHNLYEVALADGVLQPLDFPGNLGWPSISAQGDKLVYSSASARSDVWRADLLHHSSPQVLLNSTQRDDNAEYSPDSKHIVFASDRSGFWNIWMSDADGKDLVQLSRLTGMSGAPRWSPDGNVIAFENHESSRREIYTVDVSQRVPHKLLTNIPSISSPSWSRDGKWIHFKSYEPLGHEIYRCPASGGDAVVFGGQPDGTEPQESPNRELLYFAARPANTGLKVIPLNGSGHESAIAGVPSVRDGRLWTIVPTGIYFVPDDSPKTIRFFDFATKAIREIFRSPKNLGDTLSVSADGRWLLYSQTEEQNSDLMLVENFR